MWQLSAVALLVVRATLAFFFLPAAIAKVRDHRGFVAGVRDYAIVPERAVRPVAFALPIIEGCAGVALLVGIALPVIGVGVALLTLLFIGAIGVNLRRGRNINCNCYGVGATKRIGSATIARNTALLGLSIGVATISAVSVGPDKWLGMSIAGLRAVASATDAVLVALMICCVIALIYITEWTIELQGRAASLVASLNGES